MILFDLELWMLLEELIDVVFVELVVVEVCVSWKYVVDEVVCFVGDVE